MPTLQLWPLDQYPQHYLKCQASASGNSFLDEEPPTNEECDLRLRGVPRPPPPPKVYYPSQVSGLFGSIFVLISATELQTDSPMTQVPLEHDTNITMNDRSWWRL